MNKILNVPNTKNIVTLQTFDKDGNLKKEWTGENAYTCVGVNIRLHGSSDIIISGSGENITEYSTALIQFSNSISSYNNSGYFMRFTHINDDDTPISYATPPTMNSISGNKLSGNATSGYTNTADYIHNSQSYYSNNFVADFDYGTVNMTIRKVYQAFSSSTTANNLYPATCVMIPGGFEVNLDERLVITYRHLFDVLTYYNEAGGTYTLKDDYKNITLDSGTFVFGEDTIPYNIIANHLFTASISKAATSGSINWALGLNSGSSSSRTHVIRYGTSQTLNVTNAVTTKTYTSDSTKTLITRTLNIKFPPTVPSLTAISRIDVAHGFSGNTEYALSIEFPEPWDKPADTEFELTVQWVEQVGQYT